MGTPSRCPGNTPAIGWADWKSAIRQVRNLRYKFTFHAVDCNLGFSASGCIRVANVTGVDTSGHERTPTDIFSEKILLTQIWPVQ